MYKRLLQHPTTFKKSFFLLGPRGTGKTMWVKKTFPHALYFDLLKSATYTELLGNPTKIEHKIPNMKIFLEDYPDARCFLIAGVESCEYHGNIQVHPYEAALKDLPR